MQESPRHKTYLVKLGITRRGYPYGEDSFEIHILRIEGSEDATDKAMRLHMPPEFLAEDGTPQGQWVYSPTRGRGRFGFRPYCTGLQTPSTPTFYWLEKLIEVESKDVAAVRRYLEN